MRGGAYLRDTTVCHNCVFSNQWNASEQSTVVQGLMHLYFQSWFARHNPTELMKETD